MTSGVVTASDPADGPVHYTFVPDEPLLPDTVYQLACRRRPGHGWPGSRRADAVGPDRIRACGRPLPARRRHEERRSRGCDLGPLQRARWTSDPPARAFNVSVAGKSIAGTVRLGGAATRSSIFTPASPLPYGATVSMDVTTGARERDRGRLACRPRTPAFTTAAKPSVVPARPKAPSPDHEGGRRRELGRRRDVLPRSHELHPDRWLGHLDGQVQQPGRPERGAAQARQGDQLEGQPAVRQDARDRQRLQPLHRRQPGRPAAPRRLHLATAGRRTSAAGPATRTPPCWARTSSSRTRSRPTAGTT